MTSSTFDRTAHWDRRYATVEYRQLSWHTNRPTMSLRLFERAGAAPTTSVIDAGAGAALLVDELVDRGFEDLTVVDVSEVALNIVRDRLPDASAVTWVIADVLDWEPGRQWDLWHDRALFHFMNRDEHIATYRSLVARSVVPGGHAAIATFAADGPLTCSGLPIVRYSVDELAAVFSDSFDLVESHGESHITPTGNAQSYSWVLLRRRDD